MTDVAILQQIAMRVGGLSTRGNHHPQAKCGTQHRSMQKSADHLLQNFCAIKHKSYSLHRKVSNCSSWQKLVTGVSQSEGNKCTDLTHLETRACSLRSIYAISNDKARCHQARVKKLNPEKGVGPEGIQISSRRTIVNRNVAEDSRAFLNATRYPTRALHQ